MHWVFEPGFFSSNPVHVACIVGSIVAVVSGVVGVFTVMRGQSFAGHSLADVATAGGSGAFLAGISPLFGFVAGGVAGAGAMEMIGVRRARGRDLATGIVLGASIGIAALFLYLGTTRSSTTGASQQILFGSIFSIVSSTVPVVAVLSVLCVGIMTLVHRPLLLSSVSTDIAAARGVPVRVVGLLYMLALALAVGLSSLAIGAILSTASADRAGRHRPAPDEADRLGDGDGLCDRHWRHPARSPACVRQLLLELQSRLLARQFFHRRRHLPRLSGNRAPFHSDVHHATGRDRDGDGPWARAMSRAASAPSFRNTR